MSYKLNCRYKGSQILLHLVSIWTDSQNLSKSFTESVQIESLGLVASIQGPNPSKPWHHIHEGSMKSRRNALHTQLQISRITETTLPWLNLDASSGSVQIESLGLGASIQGPNPSKLWHHIHKGNMKSRRNALHTQLQIQRITETTLPCLDLGGSSGSVQIESSGLGTSIQGPNPSKLWHHIHKGSIYA